jgi:beta-galactosidase/beta-glucuronidase
MNEKGSLLLPDLFIRPEFDKSEAQVCFTPPEGCSEGTWRVAGGGTAAAEGSFRCKPGEQVTYNVSLPDFTPWSVDSPFLYTVTIGMSINGETKERIQTFGMTKTEVREKQIYFNNIPLYVRGHIRGREAHDHPNLTDLSEEEYFRKNIRATKEFGFNFIRFHSKIPPETYFKAADEEGILTHVEIRHYFGKYPERTRAHGS